MSHQNSSDLVNGIIRQINNQNNIRTNKKGKSQKKVIPTKSYTLEIENRVFGLSGEKKNATYKIIKTHQKYFSSLMFNNRLPRKNKIKKNKNNVTKRFHSVKTELKNVLSLYIANNNKKNNILTYSNNKSRNVKNNTITNLEIKTKSGIKNKVLTPPKKKINTSNFFNPIFSSTIKNNKLLFPSNNSIDNTTFSSTAAKKNKNEAKNSLFKIKGNNYSIKKQNDSNQEYENRINKINIFWKNKIKNLGKEKTDIKILAQKKKNRLQNKNDQKLFINKVINKKKKNKLLKVNIPYQTHKTSIINKSKLNNNRKSNNNKRNKTKINAYRQKETEIRNSSTQIVNTIKNNYIKNSKNLLRSLHNNTLIKDNSRKFIPDLISLIFPSKKEVKDIVKKKEYSNDTFDDQESKMINYDLGKLTYYSESDIDSISKISTKEKKNYNNKNNFKESKVIMLNEVEKTIEQISKEAKDYFDNSESSKKKHRDKSENFSIKDNSVLCNNIDEYTKDEIKKNITYIFLKNDF